MATNLETILKIKVDGTSDMVALKTEIDATQKELKTLKDEQKTAGKDSAKYSKSIVETETKLKAMRSELNKSKQETIKMNAAMNASGKSYNDLTKKNAALSVQLRKLADPLGKNKKEFQKISAEMNKNTESLKKMDKAMGRQQRNVGNYGAALSGMAVKLGAAVMAFKTMERAIGAFSEFEFQIKQVGVLSGATATQMKELSDQAKELGSSTAFTAGQVAGLQVNLSKLGFKSDEIQEMTSSTLDLAYAFGNDLGQTAEQVGITLKAFNMDASEATRVTDVMAAAFSNTMLDLEKFGVAMPKVASIAKTMGFSFEDTTTILGTLANTGMEASTSATALKNIFLKLADPTGALAKSLGRNITSVEELVPALKELEAKGIDVAGMLEITDKRSVAAFATMLSGSDDIKVLNQTLKNSEGTTKKFADVMRDSLKGRIDEVKSSAEGLVIELVEGLEPAISLLLEGVTVLFNVLKALSPVILTATAAFVGYKTVIIAGTAQTWLATKATTAYNTVNKLFTTGTKGATIAQRAFNLAVNANPIGLLVSGIAAAVALWSTFSSDAEDSAEAIKEVNTQREAFGKINMDAEKQQVNEIANVKQLISVIGNENKSREERTKAIKDLNAITPVTITNLNDEKKLAKELERAYEDAVGAIKKKIILQASEAQVAELIKEELRLQDELLASKVEEAKMRLKLKGITNEVTKEGIILGKVMNENTGLMEENANAFEFLEDEMGSMVRGYQWSADKYDEATNDHNDAINTVNGNLGTQSILTGQITELQGQQTEIMKKANETIERMGLNLDENLKKKTDDRDAYTKLKDEVSKYEQQLRNAIATGKDTTAINEKLKTAKKNLADVDNKVTKQLADNDKKLQNNNAGIIEKIAKQEKTIELEKQELKNIEKLQKAGADLAKEQIQQALDVAEAQLQLYLMQINMSDESAETQARNINRVKNEIAGLNNKLATLNEENTETAPAGFMNRALFGTGGEDAEGTAFTGADFVNALSNTIGMAMDIMAGFNALQNEQTNAQLQTMTEAKTKEVEEFKKTTEYKMMSSEDQAKAIEAIEKKHDDKMLALKIEQFEKNKKFQRSQAIMAGAMAIMQIWSSTATGNAIADAIIKSILTAGMIAMTGVQIATINAAPPPTAEFGGIEGETFADGGMVHGRSHAQGGEKFKVGGRVVELEGGEAVINKRSTAMFRPQLSAMNEAGGGKKFADGGMTFATDILQDQSLAMANALTSQEQQQVVLVEADVTDSQQSVQNIEAQATF